MISISETREKNTGVTETVLETSIEISIEKIEKTHSDTGNPQDGFPVLSYEKCLLCPRECGVNRMSGEKGFCQMPAKVLAARAALHMWEEPCISGTKGSGAVFFSGCTLRCCFCQNHDIAQGVCGMEITTERLKNIFLEQQQHGAANINLVTPTHFLPDLIPALQGAKREGLTIPIVYNCGGYEKAETIRLLDGLVDVYLPDFKYWDSELAFRFSKARDYREYAVEALAEMVRQTGPCEFDADGYIKKGTIVRHLVLPGHTKDSKKVLAYLHETYGDQIYISIMNQFTPLRNIEEYPELNRKLTKREYDKIMDYALELPVEQGFFQDQDTASESFIPMFDYEGIQECS